MAENITREPVVAGQFYPRDAWRLRESVAQYIEESGVEPAPDRVAAIVVPHAGYIYSGPTAGYAYARVKGKKPGRVVILGCSHRHHIDSACVATEGVFDTPLGPLPIDEPFARDLANRLGSGPTDPHVPEHSLEVQLPFVFEAIGEVPIVPVLFDATPTPRHTEMGKTLAGMIDDGDLVVASTDLSHHLSQEEAVAIDKRTLDAVLDQDCDAFAEGIVSRVFSMCGASAVSTAMAFALERGASSWQLLDYRTSAEASGDYDRVVGYAAISMERAA